MIRFEGVKVVSAADSRGAKTTILTGLDLELTERRIALIGANGSGKSTMARLINGLVTPTTGRVLVSENKLDTQKAGRLVREIVGFIFTDPTSQTVMPTPLEDVAISLRTRIKNRAERETHAREILAQYGLEERAGQSVHTLSGGQGQLLALAAVLATDPEVLVADEPTTLLDLKNSRHIESLLLGLKQQLIVATHNLDFAKKFDRMIWIDNGRVAFDGDPHEGVELYRKAQE